MFTKLDTTLSTVYKSTEELDSALQLLVSFHGRAEQGAQDTAHLKVPKSNLL